MRIWDISPSLICNRHLLGEHRELHAIWAIITEGKKGYRHHPEIKRWQGKLKALFLRHEEIVTEMKARGFRHASFLNESLASGLSKQDVYLDSPEKQLQILKEKDCLCLRDPYLRLSPSGGKKEGHPG